MTHLLQLYGTRIAFAVALFFAGGCQTYNAQSRAMTRAWASGHADVAAAEFSQEADARDKSKDSIVWHLEAGAAERAAGNYQESNRHFDTAAAQMDDYEQQAKVKVGHEAGAIMSNLQNLPYEGRSYDKIMLHTYEALNDLEMGQIDAARPEIIRAYQCQQDAVEDNKRRIEKAQEAEQNSPDKQRIDQTMSNPAFFQSLAGVTQPCDGFKYYADYVNPFTVYLDGLYFLYEGADAADLERARKSFSRVEEVAGDNKFVQEDMDLAGGTGSNLPPASCTYVIFEDGEAASLDQVRIDIPIIFANVSYVGAAFPKLVFHDDQAAELSIKAGDQEVKTAQLANMDSIVALDFKNEWPVILTKTLVSTVAKATAAYVADRAAEQAAQRRNPYESQNQQLAGQLVSLFTKIGTAAYQASVNIADTRSWTTLPKEFQIACIATPADRKITLSIPTSAPVDVALMDGKVNVVYVRCVDSTSPLLISQFKLK